NGDIDPGIHATNLSAEERNWHEENHINPAKTMRDNDFVADLTDQIPLDLQNTAIADVLAKMKLLRSTMPNDRWRKLAFSTALYAYSPNPWALRANSGRPVIVNMLDGLSNANPFTQNSQDLISTTSRVTLDDLLAGAQNGVSLCSDVACDSQPLGTGQILFPS